ncbi:CHAT domain protein [Ceratobasidium sp. AG-Ba]|nr:CHAT domain protein [Ceratobasidium sp. AG-Ba]
MDLYDELSPAYVPDYNTDSGSDDETFDTECDEHAHQRSYTERWGQSKNRKHSRNLLTSTQRWLDNFGQDTWILDRRLLNLDKTNPMDQAVFFLASYVPKSKENAQLYKMIDSYLNYPNSESDKSRIDEIIAMIELGVWQLLHIPQVAEPLFGILGQFYMHRFQDERCVSDIDRAIVCYSRAISIPTSSQTGRPRLLNNQGSSYLCRFNNSYDPVDLDRAIEAFMSSASLAHTALELKATILTNLGLGYHTRYRYFNSLQDCSKSIDLFLQVLALLPESDSSRIHVLQRVGLAHQTRFNRLRQVNDIEMAISYLEKSIQLGPNTSTVQPDALCNLGVAYLSQTQLQASSRDIQTGIRYLSQARKLALNNSPTLRTTLTNLGVAHQIQFRYYGDVKDLQLAIESLHEVLSIYSPEDPERAFCYVNLGIAYDRRFRRLGDLEDLNIAISYKGKATELMPEGHAEKPSCLSNLSVSYHARYKYFGSISDLESAFEYLNRAISLTAGGHPEIVPRWNNLAALHISRFEHFDTVRDIEEAIVCGGRCVSSSSPDHPSHPLYLANLGALHITRFERLGNITDISTAIESLETSILSTSTECPELPLWFDSLGVALTLRYEKQGLTADIARAIENQTHAVSNTPREHIDYPYRVSNLGNSYHRRFLSLGQTADLEQATKYQKLAASLVTTAHRYRSTILSRLSDTYIRKFELSSILKDIDDAVSLAREAVESVPGEHPLRAMQLNNLGNVYLRRFENLEDMTDLSIALEVQKKAAALIPENHPARSDVLNNLSVLYARRFDCLSDLSDIDKAIGYCKQGLLPLERSRSKSKAMLLCTMASAYRCRYQHTHAALDITQSIIAYIDGLELTHKTDINLPFRLFNLGVAFSIRFDLAGDPKDLDEAIRYLGNAVILAPEESGLLTQIHHTLGLAFQQRYHSFGVMEDLQQALGYLEEAAKSSKGPYIFRLVASDHWALVLFLQNDPSALTAYQCAMRLLPQVLWIGVTVSQRYQLITKLGDITLKAATAAIRFDDPKQALEWLEQGRSVVWNQMLRLRLPLDHLALLNPELAAKMKHVASQLDRVSSLPIGSQAFVPQNAISPELELQRQRRLAEEWESLVAEAQQLPTVSEMLAPNSFTRLAEAARDRSVVVIKIDDRECAALIIPQGTTSVVHLPLPELSRKQATNGHVQLSESLQYIHARTRGLRKPIFQKRAGEEGQFERLLEMLWDCVVQPILNSLGYLNEEHPVELPRITWCATGPLAFLPLHAAGRYNKPGPKIFDYVVSSYTPTIGALLGSSVGLSEFRGILAVGQANASGYTPLPGTIQELHAIQAHAGELPITVLEGSTATINAVASGMESHDWIHMACHGSQNLTDPTKSAFHLYDGTLDLATITRKSINRSGLAFLSACETATGDEQLPEEAVHLAAGMMVAGYPSVIATMWSIQDEDAPLISNAFYEYLLKDGVPDAAKSSMALHRAVGMLRDRVGERKLSRWVPYVHFGI